MRQTVWPVCGFADRQRRPWSQSDWLGVRTRRAQGPPEVAHHRPTFSTSGLALSLGPPRPLSLSLRGFRTFHFPACAGIVDRTREDVEITRWWNNRMTILFAAQKRLLARIRARNYLLYPVQEDCHVRFIIRVAFHIVFLEKGGGLMVRVGRVRCLNRWFRKITRINIPKIFRKKDIY